MTAIDSKIRTAAQARAAGMVVVDTTTYPWQAYVGPRFSRSRTIEILTDLEAEALAVCERFAVMQAEAMPKFNWGASFLDAKAIQLLNEVPLQVKALHGKLK